MGLWGGLPIQTNPGTGSDPHLIATIRERLYGGPPQPDGPPLDRRTASRYFFKLADGIAEGYAAFYQHPGSGKVAVYALRFSDASARPHDIDRPPAGSVADWVEIGNVSARVDGDGGACYQAVAAHLKSLLSKG
jgi:hypothetical protein